MEYKVRTKKELTGPIRTANIQSSPGFVSQDPQGLLDIRITQDYLGMPFHFPLLKPWPLHALVHIHSWYTTPDVFHISKQWTPSCGWQRKTNESHISQPFSSQQDSWIQTMDSSKKEEDFQVPSSACGGRKNVKSQVKRVKQHWQVTSRVCDLLAHNGCSSFPLLTLVKKLTLHVEDLRVCPW